MLTLLFVDEGRMAKLVGSFSVSEEEGMTVLRREFPRDAGAGEEKHGAALEAENKIIFAFTDESGARFWLISEADRFLKTILLAT